MHTTALDIPFLQFRDTTAPEQCTVQAPTGDFLEQKDAGYYFDEQVSESTSYLALSPVNDPESGLDLIFLKGQMDTKSLNKNYPVPIHQYSNEDESNATSWLQDDF
jgi:hypothetical protein